MGKSKCDGDGHSHQHVSPPPPNPPAIQIRKPSTSSSDSSDESSSEKIALQKLSSTDLAQITPTSNNTTSHLGHHSTVVIKDSPRLFLLYGIIILQLSIFITELITDQLTHSLLILTDAYHHLFIACNAILLVLCFKVS